MNYQEHYFKSALRLKHVYLTNHSLLCLWRHHLFFQARPTFTFRYSGQNKMTPLASNKLLSCIIGFKLKKRKELLMLKTFIALLLMSSMPLLSSYMEIFKSNHFEEQEKNSWSIYLYFNLLKCTCLFRKDSRTTFLSVCGTILVSAQRLGGPEEISIYLRVKFKQTTDSKSRAKVGWLNFFCIEWSALLLSGMKYKWYPMDCCFTAASKFSELPNSLGPFRKLPKALFNGEMPQRNWVQCLTVFIN